MRALGGKWVGADEAMNFVVGRSTQLDSTRTRTVCMYNNAQSTTSRDETSEIQLRIVVTELQLQHTITTTKHIARTLVLNRP